MRMRLLGRAGAVMAALLTTLMIVSATTAQAVTIARPTILSPTDRGTVAGRSTGPYTVDMTGVPAGDYDGYVSCRDADGASTDSFHTPVFTWDGSTDPVRTFTGPALSAAGPSCTWQVAPSTYRADAYANTAIVTFTVSPPPDPQVVAPKQNAIEPNGYTGPFTVDFTHAMPGDYSSTVSCYSTKWDYSATLPPQSWDGSTNPIRSFTLDTPMPTAPSCYWNVLRTTNDGANDVYGRASFSVDAPPLKISSVTQAPATFYPLVRDGYRDTTTTSFTLSRSASVTAKVINSSGKTVLTRAVSSGPLGAGAQTWSWDGKDGAGNKVAAGSYRIRLTGKDATNHTAAVSTTATVATAIVSRTSSQQLAGPSGTRSASSGCSAWRTSTEMQLDCSGGRYARARYAFTVPASTYATSFTVSGYKPADDICCDGRIAKTSSRPSKTTFAVTAQVSGWRAYVVNSVTATWKYRKRI